MAYASSPGIEFTEIDLTATAVATSTSTGAIAGPFTWGPVAMPVLVDSEDILVERFGKPNNNNAETFFTAASFLAYSKSLYVSRAADETAFNAVANTGAFTVGIQSTIRNEVHYDEAILASNNFTNAAYVAKYPGDLGNSLQISICDSARAFDSDVFAEMEASGITANTANFNFTVGSNAALVVLTSNAQADALLANTGFQVGSIVRVGNTSMGTAELRISSIAASGANVAITFDRSYALASNLTVNTASTGATLRRMWEFYRAFDRAPGTTEMVRLQGGAGDQIHVVVVDRLGKVTGVPGAVLETFGALSRATDAKLEDGTGVYYVNHINKNSKYVWWTNHAGANYTAPAATIAPLATAKAVTLNFAGGSDGGNETNMPLNSILTAYDVFRSEEDIDVSLLMQGKARGGGTGSQLANYLIDNVAEVRKDLVVFVSPPKESVVNNVGREVDAVVRFRDDCRYSSYAFMDSGYKQMYDRYNDVFRWIPLNGDMAGLAARTDETRDAWWSFAGITRGNIKNCIKLAYNPRKAERDVLYKNDINPVVSSTTEGPHLNGDKTMLGRESAFNRVNVRRLFIVLQKTIVRASKATLFEFNDDFTRAQFRNMIDPFMRDVQGRRGINKYFILCSERNNTPAVINSNRFVGSIFVTPNYSINNIQLNFVATRNGVEFETIIGQGSGV